MNQLHSHPLAGRRVWLLSVLAAAATAIGCLIAFDGSPAHSASTAPSAALEDQFGVLKQAAGAGDALPVDATIAGPARRVNVSGEPQWFVVKGSEVCVLLQGDSSSLTSGGPNSCIEADKLKADGGVLIFGFGSYPPQVPVTATPPPPHAPQVIAGIAEDGINDVVVEFSDGKVIDAPVVDNGFQVAADEQMPAEYRWVSPNGIAHNEKGGS